MPLAGGAVLVVAPGGVLAPGELGGLLAAGRGDVLWLTAWRFDAGGGGWIRGVLAGVRCLLAGGEALGRGRARRCWRRAGGCGW